MPACNQIDDSNNRLYALRSRNVGYEFPLSYVKTTSGVGCSSSQKWREHWELLHLISFAEDVIQSSLAAATAWITNQSSPSLQLLKFGNSRGTPAYGQPYLLPRGLFCQKTRHDSATMSGAKIHKRALTVVEWESMVTPGATFIPRNFFNIFRLSCFACAIQSVSQVAHALSLGYGLSGVLAADLFNVKIFKVLLSCSWFFNIKYFTWTVANYSFVVPDRIIWISLRYKDTMEIPCIYKERASNIYIKSEVEGKNLWHRIVIGNRCEF